MSASWALGSGPTVEGKDMPPGVGPPPALVVVVKGSGEVAPAECSSEGSGSYDTCTGRVTAKGTDVSPDFPSTDAPDES